jgi:hypothetical protein
LVEDGERTVKAGKKGRMKAMTPAQHEFWVRDQTDGVEYRTAAAKVNFTAVQMWKWREDRRLDPRTGRPRAA